MKEQLEKRKQLLYKKYSGYTIMNEVVITEQQKKHQYYRTCGIIGTCYK